MSRKHRANNSGMHIIYGSSQRPYGKCPVCQQMKPMYWISRVDFRCHACLKRSGQQPFLPSLKTPNEESQGNTTARAHQRGRARPLYRQQSQPKKNGRKQRNEHTQSRKPVANTSNQQASSVAPSPEVQALWDQRRAAVEQQQAEKLWQKHGQKRREVERRLAGEKNRPFMERLREYRRSRFH